MMILHDGKGMGKTGTQTRDTRVLSCFLISFLMFSFMHWLFSYFLFQFSSVAQSCPTLCDPMDCSMPGLPVHWQLPEFTQTHVHWVGDAIQPSHPLLSPSPPTFNLSQHQGLFKWVSSLHQVAKILEFQLQHVLPVNTQDWSPLG